MNVNILARFAARLLVGSLLLFAVTIGNSWAQPYPNRPIRVVIPYPAGAGIDIALRIMSQPLSEALGGQPIVVENRAGAGAIIGMEHLAKAPPDGYTIGIADAGPLAINPSVYRRLPYDPLRDFTPIVLVATLPSILLVHPSLNVSNVAELLALARTRKISYASGGAGTTSHLAMEMLKTQAGVDMLHVPYKGTAPAVAAVLGGEPSVMFGNLLSSKGSVEAGRLRAIAIASGARSGATPQLPTVAESGLAGFAFESWFGVIAPAGTPAPIVERLASAFRQVLQNSEIRRRLAEGGMDPAGAGSEAFASMLRKDIGMYSKLVNQIGLKPE